MSTKMVLSEHVQVFDTDGVLILWRDSEDLQSWLEGKEIITITRMERRGISGTTFGVKTVVTEIHIAKKIADE
jgi:heme-degrading monooxygenase HmoA